MLQKSNILYSRQQNVFIPNEKRYCFRTLNILLEGHDKHSRYWGLLCA